MALTKVSTGMLSADAASVDLNIDAGTMFIDASANRVGINNTGPTTALDVTGTVTADGLTVDGNATISVSDNSDNLTLVSTDTDANAGPNLLFKRDNNSAAGDDLMGSIVFQGEDAGNNLTDYVAFKTQIQDPTGGSEDGRLKIELMSGGTSRSLLDASGSNAIVFNEDGQALNFRVESSGNANMLFVDGTNDRVGIGTSSPDYTLDLGGATPVIRIGDAGSIQPTLTRNNSTGGLTYDTTGQSITSLIEFKDNGAERMRLDASGNLLVGTSTTTAGNEGMVYFNGSSLRVTRDSDEPLNLDRLTTDGSLINFRKNGSDVGSIGNDSNDLTINSQGGLLKFDLAGSRNYVFDTVRIYPQTDNARDLGVSSNRFRNLYLSNNISLTNASTSAFIQVSSDVLQFGTSSNDPIDFYSNNSHAMRIDSSGNLLVGKTVTTYTTDGFRANNEGFGASRTSGTVADINRNGTDGTAVAFYKAGTVVGSISVTSSATAYNTSSDQRLKENIVDAPSASDDIDAIQVRSFDWKADGSHQKYGMVAQELVTVAPEAVSAPEDPEEMMGVDYSKLVPMMLKEIQQLRARVAQLEGAN